MNDEGEAKGKELMESPSGKISEVVSPEIVQRPLRKSSSARMDRERRLLALLETRGVLSRDEAEAALEAIQAEGVDLEALLLDTHHVAKSDFGAVLSEYYSCPFLAYDERAVLEVALLKNLRIEYLRKSAWVPIKRQGTVVEILRTDPQDLDKDPDIRRAFPRLTIRVVVGLRRDLEKWLLLATEQSARGAIADILGELVHEVWSETDGTAQQITEHDSAIVRLANQLIAEADRLGASDIHIEPYSTGRDTVVRFRVDGICFPYMKIPSGYRRAVVSRIKIMANLDIAERRKPQDGKIRYRLAKDRDLELRVATLPTAGENEDVTLRLLTAKTPMPLEAMEFMPGVLQCVKELAECPQGILLCVGPTGSGKTTTLHALLKQVNTDARKIVTAEDPIELTQEGLRQVQVHPKIGFTFAAAMRAFLRADPDVIMIGEMRDKETADIAIEASLTGHLVMSTLHTNSAVETVTRLLDMGCDAFNFADAMLGVLAQRLCKRLCVHCKEPYHPDRQEFSDLVQAYGVADWDRVGVTHSPELYLYRARGCERCNQSGFKGRMALHELLVGSDEVKRCIQSRARTAEMATVARREGMVTLLQHGIQKIFEGATTYRQVRAVAVK
ncbi:GspE/PulE family protein [Nitrospira lenta]|uniref:Putative Type IV pilus assembly protein PilB n=1 Tax=Nitrospira lenta TaxID=1436998 RepID=A0A330L5C2_9BACT|nr:GspE/PulE family protein [Nitrospira lenta]SPP64887.1 putative Type IV pilus assembly protein PilB [Nitrospira lenta]